MKEGRDERPSKVSLQTRSLRYSRNFWVQATRLEKHWEDARVDAEAAEDKRIVVQTQNVRALKLLPPWPNAEMFTAATVLEIDGQRLPAPKGETLQLFKATSGRWQIAADSDNGPGRVHKSPGLQGPIDDVWFEPFLVVRPSGNCAHPRIDRWVQFELDHFLLRWRELFRGEARVKLDHQVTDEDIRKYHLIVWGDVCANALLKRALVKRDAAALLPLRWDEDGLFLGEQKFAADSHVPALIYPNPLNLKRYIVLNSGMTFREAHDRTNSQQTPKLPDWAIIDVTAPPNDTAPGKIVKAGFFDEAWNLK